MIGFSIENPLALILSILAWIIIGGVIEGLISDSLNTDILLIPSDFYDNTKMNWFGCWFCFMLISIVNPFGLIVKIFVFVGYYIISFIGWLFTAGKNNSKLSQH